MYSPRDSRRATRRVCDSSDRPGGAAKGKPQPSRCFGRRSATALACSRGSSTPSACKRSIGATPMTAAQLGFACRVRGSGNSVLNHGISRRLDVQRNHRARIAALRAGAVRDRFKRNCRVEVGLALTMAAHAFDGVSHTSSPRPWITRSSCRALCTCDTDRTAIGAFVCLPPTTAVKLIVTERAIKCVSVL